ncbi:MAG TPA: NAD(P)H-binding protein [Steroidobacteraceae bacterium]|jgi:NAD(P)H dehydrogenase (quinone)|nr:NAD(P)H-binding protein [Steroidobacteraceae bacterium]
MTQLTRRELLEMAAAGVLLSGTATPAMAAGNDRIVISGASGQLGDQAVKDLLATGVPARSLILVSRTPEALAQYAKLGAATRFGDFSKPESLPAAFAGGTRMLLISIGTSAGPRSVAHGHAIDAAKAAGVKQIAYTSWLGISKGDTQGIAVDHVATEALLRKSGVAYTFLRNSLYMEILLPQAARMVADGKATVAAHEVRVGYVSRGDCAASAAAALATPGHDNKIYDITGPALLGVADIAAAATAATGKPISVVPADPNAPAPRSFAGPSLAFTSTAVADLTGRPATTVKAFFAENRAKLGA